MSFYETSAKTNQNVSEVFNYLTEEILKANEGKTQASGVWLKKTDTKEGKVAANKKNFGWQLIIDNW